MSPGVPNGTRRCLYVLLEVKGRDSLTRWFDWERVRVDWTGGKRNDFREKYYTSKTHYVFIPPQTTIRAQELRRVRKSHENLHVLGHEEGDYNTNNLSPL